MVKSQTIGITPATHAAGHAVGGVDPLINPLLLHATRHEEGGADPIDLLPTTVSDVSGSRASGTIYQNTTGKPLYVSVVVIKSGAVGAATAYIGSASPPTTKISESLSQSGYRTSVFFIVLKDYYYKVVIDNTLEEWNEYT